MKSPTADRTVQLTVIQVRFWQISATMITMPLANAWQQVPPYTWGYLVYEAC
ncbi:hypothetical protein [Psychrobacter sp.]|uniref:hypothetical protein n=1 Tax=Psychrobacter sp. TaxID=56811 RepID=UPI003BAE1E4A